MSYETIELERDGALATLTLNRADKMNALSDQLLADFRAAFDACEKDEAIRAVIVTGPPRPMIPHEVRSRPGPPPSRS